MSIATVKTLKWSNKIQVKKAAAYVSGLFITLAVVFFKLRPYFEDAPMLRILVSGKETAQISKKIPEIDKRHLSDSINSGGIMGSLLGTSAIRGGPRSIERPKNFIIERPLFDGTMVTLKAMLTQSISSNQGSSTIEAKLLDSANLSGSFEVSYLKDAVLTGSGSPNFDTKRYNLQFSDLTSPEGKHYSVAAFAFDEKAQTVGIIAEYASGIGARLVGAALGRAIQVGEEVAVARVLTNSGSGDSAASQEMNRALRDTGHQASADMSDEATSGLRNTKAELSLPAGTVFTIKLKAASSSRGGGS